METSIILTLGNELAAIMQKHVDALRTYLSLESPAALPVPMSVLVAFQHLDSISEIPPNQTSLSLFVEAQVHLHTVNTFLNDMNQPRDEAFAETHAGQILMAMSNWVARSAAGLTHSAVHAVRKLIDPAKPDVLELLGNGLFEARWWAPVPMMDIELLRHTEGIRLEGPAFELRSMPGGLAVRFALVSLPEERMCA
jgi:hypothetical protein